MTSLVAFAILTAVCTGCQCLPEIATAPLGPRNDKLGGVCHFDGGLYRLQVRRRERHAAPLQRPMRSVRCHQTYKPARRSLSAATPHISAFSILTAACTGCECLPEIATAPLGPRNDKPEGIAPMNLCRKHCQPAWRSLPARGTPLQTQSVCTTISILNASCKRCAGRGMPRPYNARLAALQHFPLSIFHEKNPGPASGIFRQHRTIQREHSAKNDRRRPKLQLCGVALLNL